MVVNSTNIKLNISIFDADNNNDGEVDDDYLFQILNGTDWTEWIKPSGLINWSLSDNKAGNYTINVEVKNMYGITQKQIEIEYKPTKLKNGVISGYSIMLISLFIPLGGLITVCKLKKKLK